MATEKNSDAGGPVSRSVNGFAKRACDLVVATTAFVVFTKFNFYPMLNELKNEVNSI